MILDLQKQRHGMAARGASRSGLGPGCRGQRRDDKDVLFESKLSKAFQDFPLCNVSKMPIRSDQAPQKRVPGKPDSYQQMCPARKTIGEANGWVGGACGVHSLQAAADGGGHVHRDGRWGAVCVEFRADGG